MILTAPRCPECKESMYLRTIDVTSMGDTGLTYALQWLCEGKADWVKDHWPEVIAVGDE